MVLEVALEVLLHREQVDPVVDGRVGPAALCPRLLIVMPDDEVGQVLVGWESWDTGAGS